MIPKKLHFTYASEDLPERYQKNLKAWKRACPSWEFCFYSDKKVYQFFKEHFSQYYAELQKVTCGAMLADFFRYAVLYVYGGLYADIDTIPLKEIPQEWLSFSSVIGHEVQTENWEFFCQWTLLSKPKNPLFKEALEKAFQKFKALDYCVDNVDKVLETAGPLFFTSIVKKHRNDPGLLLLDTDYFAKCPEAGLPFTEKSVVRHQFDGEFAWKLNFEVPHFRLNKRCR